MEEDWEKMTIAAAVTAVPVYLSLSGERRRPSSSSHTPQKSLGLSTALDL